MMDARLTRWSPAQLQKSYTNPKAPHWKNRGEEAGEIGTRASDGSSNPCAVPLRGCRSKPPSNTLSSFPEAATVVLRATLFVERDGTLYDL